MIKIIRQGTRKTIECDKCGCFFSYENEDIRRHDIGNYDLKIYIVCPQCKNEIILEASK